MPLRIYKVTSAPHSLLVLVVLLVFRSNSIYPDFSLLLKHDGVGRVSKNQIGVLTCKFGQ